MTISSFPRINEVQFIASAIVLSGFQNHITRPAMMANPAMHLTLRIYPRKVR